MASMRFPRESLLPKVTVNLYTCTTEEMHSAFLRQALRCLNGKWYDVASSNGMFLSMVCDFFSLQTHQVFDEECYDVNEVVVTEQVLLSLETMHKPTDYAHPVLPAVNMALSILLIGKNVGPTFESRWKASRAKAMFNTLRHKWDPTYTDQLISVEWAAAIEALWDDSHMLREDCFEALLEGARFSKTDKKYYRYIVLMLRYARMTGFYLIREYLVNDKVHRVLDDPYLQSDKERLKSSMTIWASAPPSLRPYLGVIADQEIFFYFGGEYLRRLTYVALIIGRKSCPTLNDYQTTEPPDAAKLREIVERYFPPPEEERSEIGLDDDAWRYIEEIAPKLTGRLVTTEQHKLRAREMAEARELAKGRERKTKIRKPKGPTRSPGRKHHRIDGTVRTEVPESMMTDAPSETEVGDSDSSDEDDEGHSPDMESPMRQPRFK